MGKKKKPFKSPATQESIYRTMMTMTIAVASLFFIKDLASGSSKGGVIIGICLFVFIALAATMKFLKIDQYKQQFVLCVALVFLVTLISANSGNFYSDDFPLFLAVIGMSGVYLEPAYTMVQGILVTIALIVLYILHPEKADPLSQYIMCVLCLDVAAYSFYMVIKRGRAFIKLGHIRATEAESLLLAVKAIGQELETNYETSTARIDGMKEVNLRLETSTNSLKQGSAGIREGSTAANIACGDVQTRMQITEKHIDDLNTEVQKVEKALADSTHYMLEMDHQMQSVHQTIGETNEVFQKLQEQMQKISNMTNQLTSISSTTQILALNASIEAARAGKYGTGFAVVAEEVQRLAQDSSACSSEVIGVVDGIRQQIDITAKQLSESSEAIVTLLGTLSSLRGGFDGLNTQFTSLYQNIEEQNDNISNMDLIFNDLKDKVLEMSHYSQENHAMVDSIVDAVTAYKQHVTLIVDDTKHIHDLSSSMLDVSIEDVC